MDRILVVEDEEYIREFQVKLHFHMINPSLEKGFYPMQLPYLTVPKFRVQFIRLVQRIAAYLIMKPILLKMMC